MRVYSTDIENVWASMREGRGKSLGHSDVMRREGKSCNNLYHAITAKLERGTMEQERTRYTGLSFLTS